MIETYRGVVYPHQLDHMGHMNVQWYTSKFDEATWHWFSYLGITNDYIQANQRGMAALEQLTKYKSEVMVGDLLRVTTTMIEVKPKTMRFLHTMYDAARGEVVSTSELVGVHLDRVQRKGCEFPAEIEKRCEAALASKPSD